MQRERLPLAGLSPLARGTLPLYMPECRCYRFIPAGAGNTSSLHGRNKRHSVYPRWRGEHPEITLNWLSVSGLSPLARGTPRLGVRVGIIGRFIPAGAGNTWSWWKPTVPVAVYPRWRGEHLVMVETNGPGSGLSPLARGTPISVSRRICDCRFIPAGAGNTPLRFCRVSVISVYPRWRGEHSKHNLLLINDFLSQSQSTNFIVSYKQHIHYVKEHLIH